MNKYLLTLSAFFLASSAFVAHAISLPSTKEVRSLSEQGVTDYKDGKAASKDTKEIWDKKKEGGKVGFKDAAKLGDHGQTIAKDTKDTKDLVQKTFAKK